MVPEASIEDGVPQTEGWFVVNARETRWLHNELGSYCGFEGEGAASFAELGINLWTKHVIVGAGEGPSLVLAVGARGKEHARYPFDEAAVRHGAGAERETTSAREAYARFSQPRAGTVPDDF